MSRNVQHLDGNALAGVLAELMSTDASSLTITCAHCGSHGDMAEVTLRTKRPPSLAAGYSKE